ncbi:MAG: 3-chloro-4-hydroxyphenylacetate reductive dehalogenase precursor [Chlorobi bacterium OLB7]|nr:MAG: 3-chloro-4-hydroxyphenylacetate reductive dehalogenase precursor [Chlorobi bacterium OLB7]
MLELPILSASDSPPAFRWDEWYAGVGGRTIHVPEVQEYLHKIQTEQYPRCEGPVAAVRQEFGSPEEAAAHIKEKATEFGADAVGVCLIEPSDLYRGRSISETHAIALAKRMRWRAFQTVPSREAAIECMRIYYDLGETVIQLAEYIRSIGYGCNVEHPIGDSNLLHIPIALKAGFGELGRHGSVIHPRLGPLFRMGSIATTLPMATDSPIDAGIAAFCDKCRACRIYCPANANTPTTAAPKRGKITWGTIAIRLTPGAVSRTSPSITTARPVCRFASITTRSGRAISTATKPNFSPTW